MIKKTIGRGYKTDGQDILAAKTALSDLGFYKIPQYGLTPYADTTLFTAIDNFQKSLDLPVSGVMRPGDATSNALSNLFEDAQTLAAGGPTYRCPTCGAPHGGSGPPGDDRCPSCRIKDPGPDGIYYPDEDE